MPHSVEWNCESAAEEEDEVCSQLEPEYKYHYLNEVPAIYIIKDIRIYICCV